MMASERPWRYVAGAGFLILNTERDTMEESKSSVPAETNGRQSGYLVATGEGNGLACEVNGTQYPNYEAGEGAKEGDPCSVAASET